MREHSFLNDEVQVPPILLDDDNTRRAATQDVIEVLRSLGAIIVEKCRIRSVGD